MKKIVLINQVAGYLFVDIANAFAKEYDEVVLMAGTISWMNNPIDPAVKIVTIKKYDKTSLIKRSWSWLFAFIQIFFLVKIKYRKYELFICSNPPLACLLPAFCSNDSSLLLYDIYPDGLVAGKFLKPSNIIIKQWEKLNIKVYKKVKRIITLTNGMKNLIAKYVDASKIDIIPAWANDIANTTIPNSENEFIRKYNLQDKFLVVYSGNFGMGYEIEALVYLARQMKENKVVEFLIVGEGWKKKIAEDMIADFGLINCKVLPMQPSALFMHLMQAMHIGVVSLAKDASKIAIPSKTYNIIGNSKPVLCLGAKDSELATLVEKYEVGAAFDTSEIAAVATFIEQLSVPGNNLYTKYCANAKAASLNYSSLNASKIVDLVTSKA